MTDTEVQTHLENRRVIDLLNDDAKLLSQEVEANEGKSSSTKR